jgi:hypothetical protein
MMFVAARIYRHSLFGGSNLDPDVGAGVLLAGVVVVVTTVEVLSTGGTSLPIAGSGFVDIRDSGTSSTTCIEEGGEILLLRVTQKSWRGELFVSPTITLKSSTLRWTYYRAVKYDCTS